MVENVTESLRSLSFITRSNKITFNQHCACVSVYLYTGVWRGHSGRKIIWWSCDAAESLSTVWCDVCWHQFGWYRVLCITSLKRKALNMFFGISVFTIVELVCDATSSYPTVALLILQKTSSFSGSVRSYPSFPFDTLSEALKFEQYSYWVLNLWCAVCRIPLTTDHMSN